MRVNADELRNIVMSLLRAMGVEDSESRLLATVLVQADMRGIHTHGCAYIPIIAKRIGCGLITLPTKIERISDHEATTILDGNNGLGQVAATKGMEICIEKARKFGIAVTLVRNTNNIGFLGYYTIMAANQGMIGMCMTNAASALAPWGGAEPFLGTNPLSFSCPVANEAPIVLDMSSSVVARGKIRRAKRLAEKIPIGWALDPDGVPTTDPAEALKGTILPIAGPKGYGLALIIDLLCGLLSGSKYGREILTFHKPLGPTGVGATFMAINISRFMPRDRFDTLAMEYARTIRNSKKAKNIDRIFLPGEIEAENEALSGKQGVEVDQQLAEKINQLLKENHLSIRITEC